VCVYVDNAAQSVIKKALQRLLLDDKSFVIILVRDPSHCLDLGPKDLGTQKWAPTIHRFIADVKEVIVTLTADNIWGFAEIMMSDGTISPCCKPVLMSETRMYGVATMLRSVQGVKQLCFHIRENEKYRAYYTSRKQERKKKLDEIIDLVNNPEFMARAEKLECLFFQFEFAVKLCCCPSTPYSALLPIVQCVRNGVNGIIEQGWLDKLFNPNITSDEIIPCLSPRFNMDGSPPEGLRVGFLDPHAVWAYLLDPFLGEPGAPILHVLPNLTSQLEDMAAYFIPGDDESSLSERTSIVTDYREFMLGTGRWAKVVRAQPMVDENIIKQTETKITFKAVQSWLERTGGYSARTLFWATPPAMWSPLGRFVAKKLMSFTPKASMQVESAIKHLKSQVMTKYRVRLDPQKAAQYTAAGMHLRLNYANYMERFKNGSKDNY